MRNERIDFYKGLLMIGVIWGHLITNLLCGDPNTISIHWIFRTYDMPMFMLLSGYFLSLSLKKRETLQLVVDKITTILFPAVFWGGGYCLIYSNFRVYNHLYFLWAVFFCSEIAILCHFQKVKWIEFLLLVLPLVVFHLTNRPLFNLPYLYPFFLLGYYGVGLNGRINDNHKKYYVFLFITLLCFWKTKYTIWNLPSNLRVADLRIVLIIFFRLIIGIIGCIAMMHVFDIIYDYMSKRKDWLYNLIIKVGRETLALYIFQDYICFVFVKSLTHKLKNVIGYNLFNMNEAFLGYVIAPTFTIVTMFFVLVIVNKMRRYKYVEKLLGFKIPR